jgi:YVTN family beta-propeller protein
VAGRGSARGGSVAGEDMRNSDHEGVPPDPDDLGLSITGFEDLSEIGRGGYGVVFRARQPEFDRLVAIKVLTGLRDARARRRFDRERRSIGRLSGHPNIVTVYASGFMADQSPYLVMEFVAGGSLAERLAQGPVPWSDALEIGTKLASAVQDAHDAGILHRDIKPENVLVSDRGEPKLADFGIAVLQGATETRSGFTPLHAAPEVLAGQVASPAADVYSLASTVHTLIAGRSPFWRDSDDSILPLIARVANEPVPDLRPIGIPDKVCAVLEEGMAKDPDQRLASAGEFARRSEALLEEPPATPETPGRTPSEARTPTPTPEPQHPKPAVAPATPKPPEASTRTAPPDQRQPALPLHERETPGRPKHRKPAWLRVAGVLAVLALVAIAAVLVRDLGGNESSGSPAAVAATITVGPGADHVAVDSGGVWVTIAPTSTVARVDPNSNRSSPIALVSQPHSIAAGDDGLWVSTGDALVRIEPGTDPSQTRSLNVPVGIQLSEVAVGEGSVWATAAQEGELVRLDQRTQQVTARIGVGPLPDSVAVGEGGVWVANRLGGGPGTVTRVDPSSNGVVATIGVGGRPDEVAVGLGSVWVANANDGTVTRINPGTNRVTATIKVGANAQWVAVGEGAVWVSETDAGSVSRIDPATNKVTARVAVGRGPEASAVGHGSIWVVNKSDGTLSRVKPG